MYKKEYSKGPFCLKYHRVYMNILTFKIQPVSKVMTDNRSNQDFVDSFEMVTFKCQTINDILYIVNFCKQQLINFGFYILLTSQLFQTRKLRLYSYG